MNNEDTSGICQTITLSIPIDFRHVTIRRVFGISSASPVLKQEVLL